MKVERNAAYRAFLAAIEAPGATRIKEVRTRPLEVGGRTRLVLFVGEGDRAHPRLVATMPAAKDPRPPALGFAPTPIPADAAALRLALVRHCKTHARVLAGRDLAAREAPKGGEQHWRTSIRGQRHATLFASVRKALEGWVKKGKFPRRERDAALRAIRELDDAAKVGTTRFDDIDSGTYHSFSGDAPFVHYLEQMLAGLPVEGTRAMACLQPAAQESIRRQRTQALAHLDAIMRSKYAFSGTVEEQDAEKTIGGLLIDRTTRQIVSIVPGSTPTEPSYELLRIDPASEHARAGAWIHRDASGSVRLADGQRVKVDDEAIRSAPLVHQALTFARAPRDRRLRDGIAFDWNDDGAVTAGEIEWVSWAGHCDVKAVLEGIGLVLDDKPRVTELRSDTGRTQVFDRDLLLEMAASVIELGSVYDSVDGTAEGETGDTSFGGARNDAKPDRLVFPMATHGRAHWPDDGGPKSLVVRRIRFADGEQAKLETVFSRWTPDVRALDFHANPRHVRTTGEDQVEIDVTGAQIEADAEFAELDKRGDIRLRTRRIRLDLGARARGPEGGRFPLGSVVVDAQQRRIARWFYDPKGPALVRRDEWAEPRGSGFRIRVSSDEQRTRLSARRTCSVVREIRRDDPAMYQDVLDAALHEGRPCCADTDAQAPVWNGMVTRLDVAIERENPQVRVQLWRIDVTARFGTAVLRYMVRRNPQGEPVAYCPVPAGRGEQWPDFLWSELPDVASKAKIDGRWMANRTMVERGVVTIEPDRSVEGGFYVHDDHVKNVFEVLFCALSGFRWTIVHDGKRYGFTDRKRWDAARKRILARAKQLSFAE